MRNYISLLLCSALLCALCACGGQAPAEPVLRPSQLAEQLIVVNAAAAAQHRDVEQGRVTVPAVDQAAGRRTRENHTLILRQMQYIAADDHRLLSFSSEYILHDITEFVKRQSRFWGSARLRDSPGAAAEKVARPESS